MKNYKLNIGLTEKDGIKKWNANTAKSKIAKLALDVFDGITIKAVALGCYTHNNGTQVIENSVECEIYNTEISIIKEFCEILKLQFNQESIAVSEIRTTIMFI